ncbi:MAG: CheB methylesterase domain-containing protein [Defluviitaleaceae bacterium]|nr:CheB methylesterase domain-containing protein [Defluviitaleaceae bacterium]
MRIIIVSSQTDLMRSVGSELARLPCAEMVAQVSRVADTEQKINNINNHLVLVDLDSVTDLFRMQQIKNRYQLYVICVSGNAAFASASLRGGSDEFVLKPAINTPVSTVKFIDNIVKYINAYAQRQKMPAMRELNKMVTKHDRQKIVAIASSTGGTSALEVLLAGLPADIPPMVVVQHMTSGFTKLFAERLNANNKQQIREAATGDYLMRGTLLLAPADRHMKMVRREGRLAVECFVGQKLHGVMPAADILFESVAELVKGESIGVVLTGMGADGARGLKAMRAAGAKTIGQDEATCVVYGMPKVAKDIGAVMYELPLDKIAERIMSLARE